MRTGPRFGGGLSETMIHPVVLLWMLVSILLMLIIPRKYAIVPVLLCTVMTPWGEQIYFAGLHFMVYRIIILTGLGQLLLRKLTSRDKMVAGDWNTVDRAFALCIIVQAICFILTFKEAQALFYELGFVIDFLGAYVLLRSLIVTDDDVFRAIKCLAFLAIVLALSMTIEQFKHLNVFGYLGGVGLSPEVREGRIRSQGVFQHSLMAGTFAAFMIPLFIILWKNGRAKLIASIGFLGASIMTMTSNGSTPLLAYVAGLLGICLWPIRRKMRVLRWGIVVFIIVLAMIMKAPVWFAIAHIDLTGGSSGYQRAALIDVFIKHANSWWLAGTNQTDDWGFDMWDVQNQYVLVGETGGLLALIAFICVISRCFRRIGNARKIVQGDRREWFLWFLGCALFSYCTAFFGVNLFDQSRIGWLLLLAIISAVTAAPLVQTETSAATESIRLDNGANVLSEEAVPAFSTPSQRTLTAK